MKRAGIIAATLFAGAGAGLAMGSADSNRARVEGECRRQIDPSSVKTQVDIDFDKIISSGLKVAKKAIDKSIELYENSPKKEVEGDISFKVRDKGESKDSADSEFDMPFTFSIPKIDENFDAEAYFADIAADLPSKDEVLKTEQTFGISDAKLESEYKSCAAEALSNAKLKAAAKLGTDKVKLVSLSQDGGVKSSKDLEGGKIEIDVKLTAEFVKE